MGTSSSPAELGAKLRKCAGVIESTNRETLNASSLAVKTAVLRRTASATGGDLRLSGARNAKVGVRYRLTSNGRSSFIGALGPMHWLEDGVKPHVVAPRKLGGSRAQRLSFVRNAFGTGRTSLQFGKNIGALRFADGTFAKYARRAGGLKAQHVWSHGVDDARVPVRDIFATRSSTAIRKAFL